MPKVKNATDRTIPFSVVKEGFGDPDQKVVWYTVLAGETVEVPQNVVRMALAHGLSIATEDSPSSPVKASPIPNKTLQRILSKKEVYALSKKQQEELIHNLSQQLKVPVVLPARELDRVALILELQSEVKQ